MGDAFMTRRMGGHIRMVSGGSPRGRMVLPSLTMLLALWLGFAAPSVSPVAPAVSPVTPSAQQSGLATPQQASVANVGGQDATRTVPAARNVPHGRR
jgi:hypothetical protein